MEEVLGLGFGARVRVLGWGFLGVLVEKRRMDGVGSGGCSVESIGGVGFNGGGRNILWVKGN